MKTSSLFLVSYLTLITVILPAQKAEDLGRAQPFLIGLKGSIYKYTLPKNYQFDRQMGYSADFENTTPIGYVYTQSLNITERELKASFPGVPDNVKTFAIIYTGKFEIKDSTTYEFILKSDDGSRLWIDSVEVINHDGIHQFGIPKKGSVALSRGFHTIKVWYFQGLPMRMGLLLLMKRAAEKDFKPFDLKPLEDEAKQFMQIENGKVRVQFNDKLLFDFSKFDLKPEAFTPFYV